MTKPSHAIELVNNSNKIDLMLCGIEGIDRATHNLSVAYYQKEIGPDNSVQNVFGLGENNKFFYKIFSFIDNIIVQHECGTGYAYKEGDSLFFHRMLPVFWGKNINTQHVVKKDSAYVCPDGAINVLCSYSPDDYKHLFFDKNCIIASIDNFSPQAIKIQENSLVGRLSEDITNIPIEDLNLKISNTKKNKPNYLYYDKSMDRLRFYNGTNWRTVKWEDEENME